MCRRFGRVIFGVARPRVRNFGHDTAAFVRHTEHREVIMALSVVLNHRRRSIQGLFSMIHELSLGVFDHRQLKEMWDATLWHFVEDLRDRGWTAKGVAQVYGMSRDSLYRTRDARPPDKIDLSAMCIIVHALQEAGAEGLSFEGLDQRLRAHARRHRQSGASHRLMKTLDVLQANGDICVKRGRFYGVHDNALLVGEDSEAEDAFVHIALQALQARRCGKNNIVAAYALMAPADPVKRQAFMARLDQEIEAVLVRAEQWAQHQGETTPCQVAVGATDLEKES